MLIIYVQNHKIHVEKIQKCFLKIKNPTSKIIQDLDAERNVDTSRFRTGKPKKCNIHIYHFHISESHHLDFFRTFGDGGG